MFFFRFLCVDSHEFEPGGRGIRRRGGDGHGTAAQAQDDSGRHDLLTLVEALKPSMQCSKMFLMFLFLPESGICQNAISKKKTVLTFQMWKKWRELGVIYVCWVWYDCRACRGVTWWKGVW